MYEQIGAGVDFGKGIAAFAESGDGVGLVETGFDAVTNIIDNTPVGEIIKRPLIALDEQVASMERNKTIEEVKQKFSGKISKTVAQKMHGSTMVKASANDRVAYMQNAKNGADLMDQTKASFDRHQDGKGHKVKRKLHDVFRVGKKNPVKVIMIPVSFIPGGEIVKKVVKVGQYVGGKALGIRKGRKKKEYGAANGADLEQKFGEREAARKIAKWHAKDIAELGPALQRNLYKLKQSVAMLESREQQMNAQFAIAAAIPGGPAAGAAFDQLNRCTLDLAMSFHESKHYIDKVSSMCKVMEDTAFETRAHMVFLDELLVQTEKAVKANADILYK